MVRIFPIPNGSVSVNRTDDAILYDPPSGYSARLIAEYNGCRDLEIQNPDGTLTFQFLTLDTVKYWIRTRMMVC